MEDDDAIARHLTVPFCLLTVLNNVILILMAVVAHHIGHGLVVEGRHVGDSCVGSQFLGRQPSHVHAFKSRVACRNESFAIVVTIVHQVPFSHIFRTAIVKVGQSKTVAVFMTDSAEGTAGDILR